MQKTQRRLLGLAGAVAIAVALTGSAAWGQPGTPAAPAADDIGHVAFGACADPGLAQAGAECGFLSVPLDYGNPRGAKIQIAVSRIKHKVPDSQYQGIILVNPGGPGGSGLGLVTLGQFVPNHVGDAFDWIGFDPRGVGSSK